MIKMYYVLFCFVALHISAYSQDKIYYKQNKTNDWKVTAITPDYIKATDSKNPQLAYSTSHANILFVFNNIGNFLVIPKLFEKSVPDMYVKNFFKKVDNRFNEFDKIITVQNNIIVCKYESENDKKIDYTAANKKSQIAKSDVAVIIFKNGEHKLLASVDKAYKVLNEVQDLYTELAVSTEKSNDIEAKEVMKDSVLIGKLLEQKKDTPVQKPLVVNSTNNNSPATKTVKTVDSVSIKPSAPDKKDVTKENAKTEKKLDSATLLKLQDKAIQNIKLLESYIKLICNKNTEPEQADRTIDQAMLLFVSEDSRIEVSSVNTGNVQPYRVKVYLNRLGELKYEKVDIEWYNVQYTSQLRKGADGNYYGIIEFEQRFTGVSSDKKVYQDITRKTVEIVLKTYKRTVEGETTMEWDVFLGNIGITETKPA